MPKPEQVRWLDWMMAEPKEASGSPSAIRNKWRERIDEICPLDERIIWDPGLCRLVRVPKAKWE